MVVFFYMALSRNSLTYWDKNIQSTTALFLVFYQCVSIYLKIYADRFFYFWEFT